MLLWAIASMCMVSVALYSKVLNNQMAQSSGGQSDCPKRFAGGSKSHEGSCWCGWDGYCMCTPSLAIDTVVEVSNPATGEVESVLVVRRKDNGKLACIGGFVEVGETLEQATRREVMEETGLEVTSLRMLPRVYDDPARDLRRHTVSVAYVASTTGVPRAGSDAKEVISIPLPQLNGQLGEFAFDHSQILTDYLALAERATVESVEGSPPPPLGLPQDSVAGDSSTNTGSGEASGNNQQVQQPALSGSAQLRGEAAPR
eukprot:g14057.t1